MAEILLFSSIIAFLLLKYSLVVMGYVFIVFGTKGVEDVGTLLCVQLDISLWACDQGLTIVS